MPGTTRIVLALAGFALCCAAPLAALDRGAAASQEAGPSYAAWQRHRDDLTRRDDVLRYYTFETVSPESPSAPSIAGEAAALEYVDAEPLAVVAGRWPEKKAVRLDRGFFQAEPFDVGRSFTVAMWFRKHGQGVHLGNGRTNGMLFAQGDGYWSGLRVWTSYPGRDLRFEIGRPRPQSAFGLTADEPVPDGVWHHVAAVWDGRQMRLYLNGILVQAAPYAGDYSPPGSPLRIGFAGAGVGSVKMDVDEVAVFATALSPGAILRHAYLGDPPAPAVEERFLAATEAIARGDWTEAGEQFAAVGAMDGAAASHRAAARLALAQTLRRRNRPAEAVAQYAAVFEAPGAPDRLRRMAARRCIRDERGAVQALATRRVYEHLLGLDDLSPRERFTVRLCLAECALRENDPETARVQYEAALETPDLAQRDAWNVRLQIAHTHLRARDDAAARAEYARLAARGDVLPEFLSTVLLAIAHTYVREKDYAGAAKAFAGVRDCRVAPPHHRREAEQRIEEMNRLGRGLPARDPLATRVKLPPRPEPGATRYVAPQGDDDAPGTKERPFRTLQRARDAIRRLKSNGGLPKGGVEVIVRGGTYRVESTCELTEADSGTADAPIVYRAHPGETPRFSGGLDLDGFAPVADEAALRRLPGEARGKVVCLDLQSRGITDLGTLEPRGYGLAGYPTHPWVDLYVDGSPLELARWPNEGFVKVGRVDRGRFRTDESGGPGRFEFHDDRPRRWSEADDVWMFGYWGHLWAGRSVKVASIDLDGRRITTAGRTSYGYREGQPYYYFNLLEELDRPGEWYLDRAAGVLYLWPPDGLDGKVVQFPIFAAPFVKMTGTSHVTLRGLTFELGRAEGIVMHGGANNLLAGCTLRQLGTNGIIVDGGSGHGILGCDVLSVGAGGMRVAGGDPRTLTPGNHFIENCHVADFTRVDRVYAPAVHLDGVGNRIAHNLFHDSPHHGMRVEGYEHAIEYNEIHSVVYEADDQAGIDMFGNPAYRGNAIRYNYWHHIGSGHDVAGQAGIRLDDFISAVLVYGNVFYRCAGGRFGGLQIHGGKDNVVDNNLFIDCKYALSFSPWGEARWLERLEAATASVARRGVDVTRPPHSTRYPDLARMAENADRNFIWRNLAVACGEFAARDRGVNEYLDNCAFPGDPGFVDAAAGDFTLRDDAPVFDRFGFRPIPFDAIGLYHDEYRATWPVEHSVTPHYYRED